MLLSPPHSVFLILQPAHYCPNMGKCLCPLSNQKPGWVPLRDALAQFGPGVSVRGATGWWQGTKGKTQRGAELQNCPNRRQQRSMWGQPGLRGDAKTKTLTCWQRFIKVGMDQNILKTTWQQNYHYCIFHFLKSDWNVFISAQLSSGQKKKKKNR